MNLLEEVYEHLVEDVDVGGGGPVCPGGRLPEEERVLVLAADGGVQPRVQRTEVTAPSLARQDEAAVLYTADTRYTRHVLG